MTAEDIQYILRWTHIWGGITQNIWTKWCLELLCIIKLVSNKEGFVLRTVVVGNEKRSVFQIEFLNRNIMEVVLIFILFFAMITKGTEAVPISPVTLIFLPAKVTDKDGKSELVNISMVLLWLMQPNVFYLSLSEVLMKV